MNYEELRPRIRVPTIEEQKEKERQKFLLIRERSRAVCQDHYNMRQCRGIEYTDEIVSKEKCSLCNGKSTTRNNSLKEDFALYILEKKGLDITRYINDPYFEIHPDDFKSFLELNK